MANYKRIIYNDISNGEGFRTSVFLSGCPGVVWDGKKFIHCSGCFNSEAWDFKAGEPLDAKAINGIVASISPDYINGLSILGGEPMCKQNQEAVYQLVKAVREKYGNKKSIWVWTGYQLKHFAKNKIPTTKYTKKILKEIDVLIDGPFIKDLFNIDLQFCGSSNQRLLRRGKDF